MTHPVREREMPFLKRTNAVLIGLIGGGFGGVCGAWLMLIGVLLLNPLSSRGGPNTGPVFLVGMILAAICGLLGSVLGAATGRWWTDDATDPARTTTASPRHVWRWYWTLALAVTAAVVFSAAGVSWMQGSHRDGVDAGTVLFWEPTMLVSVLAFPWFLYTVSFRDTERTVRPGWLAWAAAIGLTLAGFLILPLDLWIKFFHPASALSNPPLVVPLTVVAQLAVLYLTLLVYLVRNSRPRAAESEVSFARRAVTIAGLCCVMFLAGLIEFQHHLVRSTRVRQVEDAYWRREAEESSQKNSEAIDDWLAGRTRNVDGTSVEGRLININASVWSEKFPQINDDKLLPLIELIDRQDRPLPTDALLVELKNPQRSEKIRIACLKALLTRPNLHRWMCWQTLDQLGPEAEFLMPSLAELLSQKSETNYAGQERYQQFLDFTLLTTLERLGPTAAPVVPVLEAAVSDMEHQNPSAYGPTISAGRTALRAMRGTPPD